MTPTDSNKRGNEKYDTNNYQRAIEDDTEAIDWIPTMPRPPTTAVLPALPREIRQEQARIFNKPQTRGTRLPRHYLCEMYSHWPVRGER